MSSHSWNFFRAGGFDQVKLETSDDLRNLSSLDKKLWVALALPTAGVLADARTLSLLDGDADGRVRAPDVLAAVDFVCARLRDPSEILRQPGVLRLDALNPETAAGRSVAAAAAHLLAATGRGDRREVGLADVADPKAIFATMPFNGDGVVPPFAATEPKTIAALYDVLSCMGGAPDRSGQDGVNAALVGAFFTACEAHEAWLVDGAAVHGLGEPAMTNASVALDAVRAKIEDWFARTNLVAFDARAAAAVDLSESVYPTMAADLLAADLKAMEGQPLARVTAAGSLPLTGAVNPAWRARIDAFVAAAVVPLIGERTTLTLGDWLAVQAAVSPYDTWRNSRPGAEVVGLGLARIRELLDGSAKADLLALIANDEARKPEADGVDDVIRLVHFHAHLGTILRNFVNFADFYGRRGPAVFQAGTAWFDKRSYDLVLPVVDAGRHGSMAGRSGMYLAYLDCTRRSDGLRSQVCVAVTDGDSDNLMVGRNGLFYDRQGRDYDATVVRIIDNPISLRQAFWSPYKKFVRGVEDMVAARAKAAEAESDAAVARAAEGAANLDKTAPPPAPAKIDIGTVAALGVAVGGITAAMGAIMGAIFGLGWLMPVGILGIMLLISGPSVLLAALKLRTRNLAPLLDADGWAVNASAFINLPFGRSLTQMAALPPGSSRDLADPFAEKKSRLPFFLTVLVIIVAGAAGLWAAGIITVPGL